MCGVDRDPELPATARERGCSADPRRADARITVALAEREVRAIIRATTLVADVLRSGLVRQTGSAPDSPLVIAHQALTAALQRHGIDLGIGPSPPREHS